MSRSAAPIDTLLTVPVGQDDSFIAPALAAIGADRDGIRGNLNHGSGSAQGWVYRPGPGLFRPRKRGREALGRAWFLTTLAEHP